MFNGDARRPRAFKWADGSPVLKVVICQRSPRALLGKIIQTIPVGKPSPLQQDETGYFASAVIEKNSNGFKVAKV